MPITPQQLAKQWTTEHGEDAFHSAYGISRADWIEDQARNGVGRREADKESRRMMVEAREKDRQQRIEAGNRWNEALRIMGKA